MWCNTVHPLPNAWVYHPSLHEGTDQFSAELLAMNGYSITGIQTCNLLIIRRMLFYCATQEHSSSHFERKKQTTASDCCKHSTSWWAVRNLRSCSYLCGKDWEFPLSPHMAVIIVFHNTFWIVHVTVKMCSRWSFQRKSKKKLRIVLRLFSHVLRLFSHAFTVLTKLLPWLKSAELIHLHSSKVLFTHCWINLVTWNLTLEPK